MGSPLQSVVRAPGENRMIEAGPAEIRIADEIRALKFAPSKSASAKDAPLSLASRRLALR